MPHACCNARGCVKCSLLKAQGWTMVFGGTYVQFDAQKSWRMGNYATYVGIYAPNQLHAHEPTVDPAPYPLVFQTQVYAVNG